ncbi:MAG TPA: hypothetical protein VJ851_09390 [Jatrophihabitans sp.]|nr:hypothetical protein [Jatrophihabitans sp.]
MRGAYEPHDLPSGTANSPNRMRPRDVSSATRDDLAVRLETY